MNKFIFNNSDNKKTRPKKKIKWYTYVDSSLDHKLKEFMTQFDIKNQAGLFRDGVNSYLESVSLLYQNQFKLKEYDEKSVHDFIKKSIVNFLPIDLIYKELKQIISPLKTSILMLKECKDTPVRLVEIIENSEKAIIELETLIKRRFETPALEKYIKKIDILHIEDNQLDRKTIQIFFEQRNINIISIETSEEALEILKQATPKVILLDLNLKTSRIDGIELCHLLKSREQTKHIPIVLITAIISENERAQILKETAVQEIIIKPINKLDDLNILYKYF